MLVVRLIADPAQNNVHELNEQKKNWQKVEVVWGVGVEIEGWVYI
jgi:hypothetical protein